MMKAAEIAVLVVCADLPARESICLALEGAGCTVMTASSHSEAQRAILRFNPPHLILLSLHIDHADVTLQFCRDVHRAASIPVIALADGRRGDHGAWLLEECADDLIALPATNDEIVTRVRRVLRRVSDYASNNPPATSGRPDDGPKVIDATAASASAGANLSDRETALWRILRRHENRVLSADFLLHEVWGDGSVGEGTLRVTVHRLRHKIARTGNRDEQIVTVRGRGYMYCPSPESSR